MTHVEWQGTRMEYATRGRFGGLGLKTIGDRFCEFGPQNSYEGTKKKRTTRDSIEEFASRRSYLIKGKNAPITRWFAPKYLEANEKCVIALVIRMIEPPSPLSL